MHFQNDIFSGDGLIIENEIVSTCSKMFPLRNFYVEKNLLLPHTYNTYVPTGRDRQNFHAHFPSVYETSVRRVVSS